MRPLSAGIMGLAIAAGLREEPVHAHDSDVPLSLHLPTRVSDAARAGPAPLGDAVWPLVGTAPAVHTYNVTRKGIEVEMDGKMYFLSGQPPAANCHADVNGTYGRQTIGFAKASCPSPDTGEQQREAIYNTYRFSQDANRIFLERPPVGANASLCTSVRAWDPVEQRDVPLQGELVQPLSMSPFLYEETCALTASAAPTPTGSPGNTSRTVDFDAAPSDETASNTVTALAVLGTVAGIAACMYKGITHGERVGPPAAAREAAEVELSRSLPNAQV